MLSFATVTESPQCYSKDWNGRDQVVIFHESSSIGRIVPPFQAELCVCAVS